MANLLALWRLHGWDEYLYDAWQAGVVLGGVSAGSICWHLGGTTDSFGPELRPVTNGLGWLPYSNGVHYDSEPQRRPLFHRLIGDGTLPAGYATDDGVGLVYRGTEVVEAVADRPGCAAYFVKAGPDDRGGGDGDRAAPVALTSPIAAADAAAVRVTACPGGRPLCALTERGRPNRCSRLCRGGVSEWPKEAALKAARCQSLGGSNPSASAISPAVRATDHWRSESRKVPG